MQYSYKWYHPPSSHVTLLFRPCNHENKKDRFPSLVSIKSSESHLEARHAVAATTSHHATAASHPATSAEHATAAHTATAHAAAVVVVDFLDDGTGTHGTAVHAAASHATAVAG